MGVFLKKFIYALIFFLLTGLIFAHKANAASLINVSDTLSTSRPSASAPLYTDQSAGAGLVQVVDNGSIYLASDSAVLWPDTGETLDTVNVASMSAQITGTPNTRYIYFTNAAADAHHAGDPITVAITAKHTIQFTTVTTVPSGGYIVITFPGAGQNTASPSATTFSFNGLTSSNISFSGASCSSIAVSAPTITCTTSSQITGGTTVTAVIGSATPQLINPTASSSQCSGNTCTAGPTNDVWRVSIATEDTSSNTLDSGSSEVATIQSVQVQATVEPTLTFSIAGGTADGTNINTLLSQCGSETTNTGIVPSATSVNLGILNNSIINRTVQILTVSTNASAGYVVTATSSGHFINAASGFWLTDANGGNGLTANDTPAPAAITAGTAAFGISPCGARVNASLWGTQSSTGTISGGTAKLSNPWNTAGNSYYATIASYTGGPVTSDQTVVRYAATVSGTTPAGVYTTVITYVATSTF